MRACEHACVSVWAGWARSGRVSREALWECPRCVRALERGVCASARGLGPSEGASSDPCRPQSPPPQPGLSAGETRRVTGLSKERVRVFVGLAPPLTLSCPRHPLPLLRWLARAHHTHTPSTPAHDLGPPPLEDPASPHTPAVRPKPPSFLRILGPRAPSARAGDWGWGRPYRPGPSRGPLKSRSPSPAVGIGGQKCSPLPSRGPRPRSPLPHRGRGPGRATEPRRSGRRAGCGRRRTTPPRSAPGPSARPPAPRAPASRAPGRPPRPSPSPRPGPHSRPPRAPARSRSAPLRRLPPLTGPGAPTPWHRAPLRALPPPPGLSPPPPLPSRPPPSRSPAPLLLRRRRRRRRLLRLLLPGCSGSLQLGRRPGPRGCHHHVARGGGPRGAAGRRLAARRAPTRSPPRGLPSPPTGAVSADCVLCAGAPRAGLGAAHFAKK